MKIIIYILAFIGFGYLLLMVLFSFGVLPSCEVTKIKVAISPDKQHEAILVNEKCDHQADPMLELKNYK